MDEGDRAGDFADLVSLEVPDEVPDAGASRERFHFGEELLDAVFAEVARSQVDERGGDGRRYGLGDGNEAPGVLTASSALGGGGSAVEDAPVVGGKVVVAIALGSISANRG